MLLVYSMIFMHIIGDYALQSVCNFHNMKQESWWKRTCDIDDLSESKFKNDYKLILYLHALSWTICILIPIVLDHYLLYHKFYFGFEMFIHSALIANTCIHAIVDDMKANMNVINLVTDQVIHFVQIVVTLLLYVIFFK